MRVHEPTRDAGILLGRFTFKGEAEAGVRSEITAPGTPIVPSGAWPSLRDSKLISVAYGHNAQSSIKPAYSCNEEIAGSVQLTIVASHPPIATSATTSGSDISAPSPARMAMPLCSVWMNHASRVASRAAGRSPSSTAWTSRKRINSKPSLPTLARLIMQPRGISP